MQTYVRQTLSCLGAGSVVVAGTAAFMIWLDCQLSLIAAAFVTIAGLLRGIGTTFEATAGLCIEMTVDGVVLIVLPVGALRAASATNAVGDLVAFPVEMLVGCADARTLPASAGGGVRSAGAPTVVVLWAHGDPEWDADDEEVWQSTVLAFAHLLLDGAIDADLDLFHRHTGTDWARFGPRAIRDSDYALVAVSQTWRRAWDGDIEPGEYSGTVGEANMLRGLLRESHQRFLERVIPVLLPGRGESDLPTELKATSHWERVPTLDEQGIETLYRRITGQPVDPKPPLGEFRTLPPRPPPR